MLELNSQPLQAKALAISTVCCTVLGAGLYFAASWTGLEWSTSTDVSSHHAVELAEEQRVCLRPCNSSFISKYVFAACHIAARWGLLVWQNQHKH